MAAQRAHRPFAQLRPDSRLRAAAACAPPNWRFRRSDRRAPSTQPRAGGRAREVPLPPPPPVAPGARAAGADDVLPHVRIARKCCIRTRLVAGRASEHGAERHGVARRGGGAASRVAARVNAFTTACERESTRVRTAPPPPPHRNELVGNNSHGCVCFPRNRIAKRLDSGWRRCEHARRHPVQPASTPRALEPDALH